MTKNHHRKIKGQKSKVPWEYAKPIIKRKNPFVTKDRNPGRKEKIVQRKIQNIYLKGRRARTMSKELDAINPADIMSYSEVLRSHLEEDNQHDGIKYFNS